LLEERILIFQILLSQYKKFFSNPFLSKKKDIKKQEKRMENTIYVIDLDKVIGNARSIDEIMSKNFDCFNEDIGGFPEKTDSLSFNEIGNAYQFPHNTIIFFTRRSKKEKELIFYWMQQKGVFLFDKFFFKEDLDELNYENIVEYEYSYKKVENFIDKTVETSLMSRYKSEGFDNQGLKNRILKGEENVW
jgi:hypothetical protein